MLRGDKSLFGAMGLNVREFISNQFKLFNYNKYGQYKTHAMFVIILKLA